MQTVSKNPGQVFTDAPFVEKMCALCEPDLSDSTKTVLEPSCGTGNFLVEILDRRFKRAHADENKALLILANLYGIDINLDNILIARARLLDKFLEHFQILSHQTHIVKQVILILQANIIQGDFLDSSSISNFSKLAFSS